MSYLLRFSPALQAADQVVTLKYTVKAIAASMGLVASFMPKPIGGINGSGMHAHQSLLRKPVQRDLLDAFAGTPQLGVAGGTLFNDDGTVNHAGAEITRPSATGPWTRQLRTYSS